MVPLRDDITKGLRDSFRAGMASQKRPLVCVEEGILTGQDDWEDTEDETTIECWWGIFAYEAS